MLRRINARCQQNRMTMWQLTANSPNKQKRTISIATIFRRLYGLEIVHNICVPAPVIAFRKEMAPQEWYTCHHHAQSPANYYLGLRTVDQGMHSTCGANIVRCRCCITYLLISPRATSYCPTILQAPIPFAGTIPLRLTTTAMINDTAVLETIFELTESD